MQKSDDLRKNAENCAEKAETAATPRLGLASSGWRRRGKPADNQPWLEGDQKGPSPQRRE